MGPYDLDWRQIFRAWSHSDRQYVRSILDEIDNSQPKRIKLIGKE
jgi:hypothetical protein